MKNIKITTIVLLVFVSALFAGNSEPSNFLNVPDWVFATIALALGAIGASGAWLLVVHSIGERAGLVLRELADVADELATLDPKCGESLKGLFVEIKDVYKLFKNWNHIDTTKALDITERKISQAKQIKGLRNG